MANTKGGASAPDKGSGDERIPFMQQLLDNPFLLLFLGVVIPAAVYLIWGILEVTNLPLAK